MNKPLTISLSHAEDRQAASLFIRLMDLWHDKEVVLIHQGEGDVVVSRCANLPEEGFRIVSDGKKVAISGCDTRGVAYGLGEIVQRYANGAFPVTDEKQSPRTSYRGIHLYLPAPEDVEAFYQLIDMMVLSKHNILMLETAGGMEYKRHPEINEGWVRFCQQVENFPGGTNGFQGSSTAHWKNSTHTELAGGSFLSQDIVRSFVTYGRAYGFEVMPEIQMLSHAYYITTVYPELAERKEDHYPDTVCPRNESAYQLYFELAEETLEVFQSSIVSIGHDEIWTMGFCDECKKYTGHELLAYEINRLHEFYSARGIRMAMWSDRLIDLENIFTKKPYGGVESVANDQYGRPWHIPAMSGASKLIPKDVLWLDWMYGWNWHTQDQAGEMGFQLVFGNFHGEWMRGIERRFKENVLGGKTSSWCRADEWTLGHDSILGDIWYGGKILWDSCHDENNYDKYHAQMRREMPLLQELLQDRQSVRASYRPCNLDGVSALYIGESDTYICKAADLPTTPFFNTLREKLPETFGGQLLGEKFLTIPVGDTAKRLVFIHSTRGNREQKLSYNIPITEWSPVVYSIRYADGVTLFAQAYFGTDIGNIKMKMGRSLNLQGVTPEDRYGWGNDESAMTDTPLYIPSDLWQSSLMYSALPFYTGDSTLYIMEWVNPRPEVEIEQIFAVNTSSDSIAAGSIEEQAILYCVASTCC